MPNHIAGKFSEIVLAQFIPGEDLLQGFRKVCVERGIKTGVIFDFTGSLMHARLQKFPEKGAVDKTAVIVVDIEGPMEATGHGLIGMTVGSDAPYPEGWGHVDGEPYVHSHMTVTSPDGTICGHLMDGTIVRSRRDKSHFTAVIGVIEGARVDCMVDSFRTDAKGRHSGGIYHELRAVSDTTK